MHMVYEASKLGKVSTPRTDLASGAAAVALIAALGGALLAALGALHPVVGGAFPSLADIVRAIVVR